MPVQVKRLLLVFAILIALSIVLKYYLTPESFGEYGHYRGKALEEIASKEAKFTQKDDCAMCHDSIAELKSSGVHDPLQCEVCHGPGFKHIEDDELNKMDINKSGELCMRCHSINAASRKKVIKQIDAVEHAEGEECITCHNPHQPWL
jgi:nitrate/TMAO reductase-like tetraheme cytochrome c subunit